MSRPTSRNRLSPRGEFLDARLVLATITFSSHEVECCAAQVESLELADLDHDGDVDIVATLSEELVWYENIDGQGDFGRQKTIFSDHGAPLAIMFGDLDGDGDNDLAVASFEDLRWYENQNGNFGNAQIIREPDGLFEGLDSSMIASDLDQDGDNDILLSFTFDDQTIEWYENTDGQGNFSGPHHIATQNDVSETSVFVSDLNGDNHLDILASSSRDETIVWYEGKGEGRFEDAQAVSSADDDALSVVSVDLDGDGDQDVLSASYYHEQVKWYENIDGQAASFKEHVIDSIAVENAFFINLKIEAADLDGDGDSDIVLDSARFDRSRQLYTNEVAWYENLNGLGSFGEHEIILSQPDAHYRLAAELADLDGDGDVDIVSAAHRAGRISWHENRIPGDVNDDGMFDSADLVALFQAGEYEDELDGNSTFEEGDWNGDGDADSADLVLAFQSGRFVMAANGLRNLYHRTG